jgi:hypothetical protein
MPASLRSVRARASVATKAELSEGFLEQLAAPEARLLMARLFGQLESSPQMPLASALAGDRLEGG